MAHVDIVTGKIYGCKKNSLAWYHEKGHIVFNNLEYGNNLQFLQEQSFYACFFFLVANAIYSMLLFKIFIGLFFAAYSMFNLHEEIWCWVYARTMRSRIKNRKIYKQGEVK